MPSRPHALSAPCPFSPVPFWSQFPRVARMCGVRFSFWHCSLIFPAATLTRWTAPILVCCSHAVASRRGSSALSHCASRCVDTTGFRLLPRLILAFILAGSGPCARSRLAHCRARARCACWQVMASAATPASFTTPTAMEFSMATDNRISIESVCRNIIRSQTSFGATNGLCRFGKQEGRCCSMH